MNLIIKMLTVMYTVLCQINTTINKDEIKLLVNVDLDALFCLMLGFPSTVPIKPIFESYVIHQANIHP